MLRVLKYAGHYCSSIEKKEQHNHIFAVWQYMMVLLTMRQYWGVSYRMFAEWLVEAAHYLKTFLQLSRVPHFTAMQKFAARISGILRGRERIIPLPSSC